MISRISHIEQKSDNSASKSCGIDSSGHMCSGKHILANSQVSSRQEAAMAFPDLTALHEGSPIIF